VPRRRSASPPSSERDCPEFCVTAFHTSNKFVDVDAVVHSTAHALGLKARSFSSTRRLPAGESSSTWTIVTDNDAFIDHRRIQVAASKLTDDAPSVTASTDNYASLWSVFRLGDGASKNRWKDAPNRGQFIVDEGQLMSVANARDAQRIAAELFHDSGGRLSLLAITQGKRTQGLQPRPAPNLERLYRRYHRRPTGPMLVLSVDTGHAEVVLPGRWPRRLVSELRSSVGAAFPRGVRRNDVSRNTLRALKAMNQKLRLAFEDNFEPVQETLGGS
jgi:hypothetical protein